MGEAKKRGTFLERKEKAIMAKEKLLVQELEESKIRSSSKPKLNPSANAVLISAIAMGMGITK